MAWHFYVVLGLGTVVFFLLKKKLNAWADHQMKELYPELEVVKFYGGPHDGVEQRVFQREAHYILPYTPDPEKDEAEVVGNVQGRPIVMPKFAYYQQVMDADYFYTRDVEPGELEQVLNPDDS